MKGIFTIFVRIRIFMGKILVTGGCGYIGSHTIVDLLEQGYECVSLDNYLNSDPSVLAQIKEITGKTIKNYEVDLVNRKAVHEVFEAEEIHAIIHFAALKAVGESVEKPLIYYRNNIEGQINLLEAAIKNDVKHFIFSSSCTVYGQTKKLPVTEETPIERALSPYGFTKQVCERIIEDSILTNEMNACLLRYFNPAGAHESLKLGESPINPPQNLVPIITEVGIGNREKLNVFGADYETRDGSCVRDYIHVMDLADAHTKALQYLEESKVENGKAEAFNLGSGEGITVLEAIKNWEEVSGIELNYTVDNRRPGDIPAMFADYSKAKEKLGWDPKRGIREIMDSAWRWEKVRNNNL
jgi:UDP-glucose 4-epimerase